MATPQQYTLDRAPRLEEAQRLLHAALTAVFSNTEIPDVLIAPSGGDDGDWGDWVEVEGGQAALEAVEVTVPHGLGSGTHQAIYWRVYQETDASDPSVGLFGSELTPAQPYGVPHEWTLPGRLTAALSHDLGVSDDVLTAHLAKHNLVVTRVWGQDGCYAYLRDAIAHVVTNLVRYCIEIALENEGDTIAREQGEL